MNIPHPKTSPAALSAGFTLMEMILVLAIISLLLGTGVYYMVGVLDDAKLQKAEADISTLETNLTRYQTMALRFPTTEQGLQALVTRPTVEPQPRKWTKKTEVEALTDPWSNPYQYLSPGKNNPTEYDVWSMGPDGQSGTGDDIGNWSP